MVGSVYRGGHSSTRVLKDNDSYTISNPGPYVGIVKDNRDVNRMGALRVNIPAISHIDNVTSDGLYTVQYLAPFYGAKSPSAVKPSAVANYEDSQHSYGFWAVPPDIDTRVLVIFAEGDTTQGYWIGCVQEPYTNHMVPGIAATADTFSPVPPGGPQGDFDFETKESTYGTDFVPAGEANRSLYADATQQGIDRLKKPVHPFAETLRSQGLIQDDVRGTTSSSARRESPSRVFGMSTPGPEKPDSKKTDKLGPKDAKQNLKTTRSAGHTFVMDDGDVGGNNKLIRLRTGGGHQLLMHDTAGIIYIANASGNAWMEFDSSGRIDIYSADSINLRSTTDFNIHSDANVNIYAKNQVKIRGKEGLSLDGKNILGYADYDIKLQATDGFMRSRAKGGIYSYSGGNQWHNAAGNIDLSASQVHFNSKDPSDSYIPQIDRTLYYDLSGTGTKDVDVDDVITVNKRKLLVREPRKNSTMTGMGQIPTHEPAVHANNVIRFYGVSDSTNSNVIGTAEHLASRNRNSLIDPVRLGQAQADLEVHLREKFPGASQAVLETEAKKFIDGYKQRYGIPDHLNLSFLTSGVQDAVKQVTESITGKAVNLLKDQVFIKDSKVLFTSGNLGQSVQSTTKLFQDLSTGNISTKTIGDILGGSVKLPGGDIGIVLPKEFKNIPGVDKVTGTVKTVVGGSTTAITQVTSAINNATKKVVASVGKAIGNIFG